MKRLLLCMMVVAGPLTAAESEDALFSRMGLAGPLDKAAELKEAGAEFLTVGVGSLLVPDKSDEEFEKRLAKAKASPLPVLACNGFIRPKHLRCVGEEANHDEVLEWAATTFERANRVGAKFIVFGSSGSRNLRDGWPKEKADAQFVALLRKMGPLAREQEITVVVEPLNQKECNYLMTLGEVAEIVREVDDANVKALADLYHMAVMGEGPEALEQAMDVVVHIEIAEKDGRTVPGVKGDDFRPFFEVLREAGYDGAISIEGRWKPDQLPKAFATMREQAG